MGSTRQAFSRVLMYLNMFWCVFSCCSLFALASLAYKNIIHRSKLDTTRPRGSSAVSDESDLANTVRADIAATMPPRPSPHGSPRPRLAPSSPSTASPLRRIVNSPSRFVASPGRQKDILAPSVCVRNHFVPDSCYFGRFVS